MTDSFDIHPISLPTGVTLDVAVAGHAGNPAVILLHGFPESHRTWRKIIPDLARDHFVLAPDQRGFAGSSKPVGVENYTPDKPAADMIALADHFGIDRFTLVGHDWGGAIAWLGALQNPRRVEKLVIVNAPHPFVFQRTMFDDMPQRAASQYIRAFRDPDIEKHIEAMGIERFFDTTFARHIDAAKIGDERQVYVDQWSRPDAMTAMLNWYKGATVIVPAMDETPKRPAFLDAPFPPVTQKTLVIWGLGDTALLPSQLDGLEDLVPDLTVVKADAGHFVTWENAPAVIAAMRDWGV